MPRLANCSSSPSARWGVLRDAARHGADRVRLGHPPALDHLDAVAVPVPADEGDRRGGAARAKAREVREVVPIRLGLEQGAHPLPDRGHPGRDGDRLRHHEVEELVRGHEAVRHDLLRAQHGRGVREAPAHCVEHRHDAAGAVGAGEAHDVRHRLAHGVEIGRAMGVHHPFRVAGGAARVAKPEGRVLVEFGPCDARAEPTQERLVVDRVRERRLPRLGAGLAADDVSFDRGEVVGDPLEEGCEVRVHGIRCGRRRG